MHSELDPEPGPAPESIILPTCVVALFLAIVSPLLIIEMFTQDIELGAGTAATLGVPFALGAFLGLCMSDLSRVATWACTVLCITTFVFLLPTLGPMGIFCAALYLCIALPTALLGASIVHLLMFRLRKHSPPPGPWRSVLVFVLPLAVHGVEIVIGSTRTTEQISSTADFDAPISKVWHQQILQTGEEIEPDGWFRIGAPKPQETKGSATRLGDIKTIRFRKGYLRVRVADVDPPHSMRCTVFEQYDVEDRAAQIHEILIDCRTISDGRTQATLSFTYTPLLTPRWCWRPLERFFAGYVLDRTLESWGRVSRSPSALKSQ